MLQTEITVQLFEDIKDVENKLIKLGFCKTEELNIQENYFTNLKNDALKNASYSNLLVTSVILRSYTTLKNKVPTAKLIRRLENLDSHNYAVGEERVIKEVEDGVHSRKVMTNIGYTNWVTLKQKNIYYKKGEITIILSDVEGLGNFIEVEEYPSISNLVETEKIDILKKYINSFNFKIGNDFSCKKVYMLYQKNNTI